MRVRIRLPLALALSAWCGICGPAQAGNPKAEADRWLDAFFHGQIDRAAVIATEQLRPDDVPDVYVAAQRDSLKRLYEFIYKTGAGAPKDASLLDDVEIRETGDVIKRQKRFFASNAHAYVGCVSYPGTDGSWHLVVKLDDDLTTLTTKLENAATSRVTSPPERN